MQKLLAQLFSGVLMVVLSQVALAEEIKTEEKQTALVDQCQALFKETESLIAEVEKQPGTHVQVKEIKNKLKQSKEQILAMDLAVQIKSCELGLSKITASRQE